MTGQEFKELRESRGLSQVQLANLIGKDRATIQRWEATDGELDFFNTLAIERAFQLTPKQLEKKQTR